MKIFKWFAGLGLLVLVFLVCFLTMEDSAVVDWGQLRAVAFESDDWGLAGFVPSGDVWNGHQRDILSPGNFPDVYWESTLEDSLMVSQLCGIMAAKVGADGLPAVFQPNYVMSSLSYEKEPSGWVWRRYDLPLLPPVYERSGMWKAVQQGIESGVWYPEFHATWHYDPRLRLESSLKTDFSRQMAEAGVTLFPGSEKARELSPRRPITDLKAELIQSQITFTEVFQRPMGAIIAPDYTWDDRVEKMWQELGVLVIQGKREQRDPTLPGGLLGRGQKLFKRKWALLAHPQRVYLERNCRLEPVQSQQPLATVMSCTEDTRKAWSLGQPAIVETHRINYSHDDPEIVQLGQSSLVHYLDAICDDPEKLPVFMVDAEIAQLQKRGVSWVFRGEQLVLRNATHSRRLVMITHKNSTKWFGLGAETVFVTEW